jgi:hypothetical protein
MPCHFERHCFGFDERSPADVRPAKEKYSELQQFG